MSEPQFHADRLQKLIDHFRDAPEALEFICGCVQFFSDYHAAIVEMEFWLKIYNYDNLEKSIFQDQRVRLDRSRTTLHSVVISQVAALNRMAAAAGLEPIYDGTVSEEVPTAARLPTGCWGTSSSWSTTGYSAAARRQTADEQP